MPPSISATTTHPPSPPVTPADASPGAVGLWTGMLAQATNTKPASRPPGDPASRPPGDKGSLAPYRNSGFTLRTEDIDRKNPISTIYVSSALAVPYRELIPQLREVGKRRGFEVVVDAAPTLPNHLWAEDGAIIFTKRDGTPSMLVSSVTAAEFNAARRAVLGLLPSSGKDKPLGDIEGLGRVFRYGDNARIGERAEQKGFDVRWTPLAIDGGNLIATRTKDGAPAALIGRNSVLVNWQLLRQKGLLPEAEVRRVLESGGWDKTLAAQLTGLSAARGARIPPGEAQRQAAEVEVTRRIIAGGLGLDQKNLHVSEQDGFHIDMQSRFIGNGVVLVSDPVASRRTLEAGIAELSRSAPNSFELQSLMALRERTQRVLSPGAQGRLDRKAESLRRAGFQVIRAPLNFGGIGASGDSKGQDMNFANSIAASDRSGRPYLMTGHSISTWLDRRFASDMKKLGVEVEFVNIGDLLADQGGLDCVTLHKDLKGGGKAK